jgi:transketolase
MIALEKDIRQQFADTMLEIGTQDERLVVIVGDISHFKLQPFAQACPGRFYNIGILEPTMVSMTAGFAKAGFLPVVHTIAPFLIERSLEQIKLDFGYQRLPGNMITVGSAFDYAALGCTHHCYGDFAVLKTVPGTQITFPATAREFDALFRQAYANDAFTVYRLPGTPHGVEFSASDIRFGEAIRVAEGSDATVVVTGPELGAVMSARRRLEAHGRSIEVLYVHTIRPLDVERIRLSAVKTRRVLVVEEHLRSGGLGLDVLAEIYDVADLRFAQRCLPDAFQRDYGVYEDHVRAVGMDADGITAAIEGLWS